MCANIYVYTVYVMYVDEEVALYAMAKMKTRTYYKTFYAFHSQFRLRLLVLFFL